MPDYVQLTGLAEHCTTPSPFSGRRLSSGQCDRSQWRLRLEDRTLPASAKALALRHELYYIRLIAPGRYAESTPEDPQPSVPNTNPSRSAETAQPTLVRQSSCIAFAP